MLISRATKKAASIRTDGFCFNLLSHSARGGHHFAARHAFGHHH